MACTLAYIPVINANSGHVRGHIIN